MPEHRAGALVIFGITGDLAKKLVLPALYRLEGRRLLDQPVIGVARTSWDDGDLRTHARQSVKDGVGEVDDAVFGRFADRLHYVRGSYDDPATFTRLRADLGDRADSAVFYLAVPPSLFTVIAGALAREGLNRHSHLVVEKPFGHDLTSARALNEELGRSFDGSRLLRVDHFLGKESVEDLFVFRFANGLFEPIWNRDHVRSVQLTFAEQLDVADRGGFYDEVGAVRDVVQNHLFQVIAHLAMDPPSGDDPGAAEQRERTRLLRSVRTVAERDVVRGQYGGYREVDGVRARSRTETFVALRMAIDNPRWEGVPFVVRTGKCLPTTVLEAVVELRPAPRLPQLRTESGTSTANLVRIRLQPGSGVTCEVLAKQPGPGYATRPVPLTVDFGHELGPAPLAYEQVLADALVGSDAHFTSQAAVEQSWRIVERIVEPGERPETYVRGSWGPAAAERLAGRGGWLPVGADDPTS